jgi:hypothetical protein
LFPRNPPIAPGATLIRSIDRLLDEAKRNKKFLAGYDDAIFLSLYPNKKNSAIASGATPIGSAGRAPDETNTIRMELE